MLWLYEVEKGTGLFVVKGGGFICGLLDFVVVNKSVNFVLEKK